MNVRCINVENYKLTEGKIYPIANETRDFYSLLNDNNIPKSSYSFEKPLISIQFYYSISNLLML